MRCRFQWIVEDEYGFLVARAETQCQALIRDAGLQGTMFDGVAFIRAVARQEASGELRCRQVKEFQIEGEWYVG